MPRSRKRNQALDKSQYTPVEALEEMISDRGSTPLASTTISAQMGAPDKGLASILHIYQLTHQMVSREILKHLLFEKDRMYNALPHVNIKAIGR